MISQRYKPDIFTNQTLAYFKIFTYIIGTKSYWMTPVFQSEN